MTEVTLNGAKVKLSGNCVKVGEKVSEIELVAKDLSTFKVGGNCDKLQLLICVPSLDTPVCANETRKFNQIMAKNKNLQISIISMDLPFAMGRFCVSEGIENLRVGSDFRNKEFGEKFGVLIADGALKGLHARAVFIVDKEGVLIYKQIVKEIADEPNYDEISKFLQGIGA